MSTEETLPAVAFVELSRHQAEVQADLRVAFERVTARGDYVLGEELALFETEFAAYVGATTCIGVGSGTSALTIALLAAGIAPGDEVIVPAHTFIASALPVLHAGATPIFCDVDDSTGLIDLDSASSVVSPRTTALIAVHLYGQPCDMTATCGFADRHGLALIEDAAQAHGAAWDDRKAGSFGTASAFSFYPSKNLGALGDAGAICTSDPSIAGRARRLRNLGQRAKGDHSESGYNERLDTLQAAFLRVKLPRLDNWNRERRQAASEYRAALPAGVRPLPTRERATDAVHLFAVRIDDRDAISLALSEMGIATGVHYHPAVHRQPPFIADGSELPIAERWAAEELSLPMFAGLRTAEVHRVCSALEAALTQAPTGRLSSGLGR